MALVKKIPDNDAFEALEKIKKAEERAREIIQEARDKTTSQIIQDSHDEAEKIKTQLLTEAKEKAIRIKQKIIDRATKEKDRILKESDEEISDLYKKSRSRMPEAVAKIREKVDLSLKKGAL